MPLQAMIDDGTTSALIGATGFVGSNVLRRRPFDDLYNSANISDIAGKRYDIVVCAAGRADSFRINQDPQRDLAEIDALLAQLTTASIERLVLVSTVCVYAQSGASDETTEIEPALLTPYGRNRYHLEQALRERFDTLAMRLPQLYGYGLRKGIVYDLMNAYRLEFIRPADRFQYYDPARLWDDAVIALDAGLGVLNVATPPILHRRVAAEVFGIDLSGQVPPEPDSVFLDMYTRNMTTRYAAMFGRSDHYLMSEEEVLASIRLFVDRTTRTTPWRPPLGRGG